MDNRFLVSKLFELTSLVRERAGENIKVDARPIAAKLGINLDEVMAEIIDVCEKETYFVGGHMNCTRWNVIPEYQAKHEVYLDRDHAEGLAQILSVHYKFKPDY